MWIRIPRGWEIPEREATPEWVYWNRREFLRKMGWTGLGLWALLQGCEGPPSAPPVENEASPETTPHPVARTLRSTRPLEGVSQNLRYTLDRPLTPELVAARYNNFYEFSPWKELVWRLAQRLPTSPWRLEVTGLVERPWVVEVDELIRKMPLEERLYRFRCVEAWAMAVPWIGFPFRALMDRVRPLSQARYVRFTAFLNRKVAFGQLTPGYPWPYTEGLTLQEAANELTFLAVGIYGHTLPKQHGAPVRLVVPWKYGFKSIKSIVRIEFVRERPANFWHVVTPDEYDFWANVNPKIPHPRWSQETEVLLGSGERRPTLLYNGYGPFVAHLYA